MAATARITNILFLIKTPEWVLLTDRHTRLPGLPRPHTHYLPYLHRTRIP
ncbi:hypothetical protein JOE39_001578 [Pseudomonas sp. PvP100]|nr:hypothetical protein [Pseudomonas sp. PvP007]MBP1193599.1 hypothetical protein [Pseudomonas sp. PvP100]